MTVISAPPVIVDPDQSDEDAGVRQRVVLRNISWDTYEALLRDLEEEHFLLTYDEGTLEIMAPAPLHDRSGRLLGRLLCAYTEVRDIPIASFGGTTWKRKDRRKGLEPDECFYIRSEPLVRGRDDIDLTNDPPPDLMIEVENTRSSMNKLAIYVALGVPELWRYRKERLTVYALQPDGTYSVSNVSPSFPDLPLGEIERFMHQQHGTSETEWIRSFRQWVTQHYGA